MTFDEWISKRPMNGIYVGDLRAAWNAAIAARDEELRKQEPVGYTDPLYLRVRQSTNGFSARYEADEINKVPLFTHAIPIPPDANMPPKPPMLDKESWEECEDSFNHIIKLLRGEKEAIALLLHIRQIVRSFVAPIPTPSQQEAVYFWRDKESHHWNQCLKEYYESVSKFPQDYDVGVMFILARPDEVTK